MHEAKNRQFFAQIWRENCDKFAQRLPHERTLLGICENLLNRVIITSPITPNKFWGFDKRNSQEKLHILVLFPLGRSTPQITPKYSQRSNCHKFHLCCTSKFSANSLCNPNGPNGKLAVFGTLFSIHVLRNAKNTYILDDRQITHLICVRLKHLLCDFLGGFLGFYIRKQQEAQTPPKSHIANDLGGHRLDE